MSGFEVFTESLMPSRREPTVTIQKNGVLSLNKAADNALGSPPAVELLFDPQRRVLGLRPADPASDRARPMRAVAGPGAAPFIVSAAVFLTHYGIEHTVSRRWPAYADDGVLCIDLDGPSIVVTSNRAKNPPHTD